MLGVQGFNVRGLMCAAAATRQEGDSVSFQTLSGWEKSQQGATAFALWTGSASTGHQRMHLRFLQTKFNHAA